jgi:hypothetical protein
MKKLLLVLMVVAMASFLFVGCLPGIVDDGDGNGDGDGDDVVVPVAMTIEEEYKSTVGVTYVGCAKDVTVTFPTAVEADYIVYVAKKVIVSGTVTYTSQVATTPNVGRTIWTVEDYSFGEIAEECEPICLVALLKHPCCPGEEVALRVVTVDCELPYADLAVTFKDCFDPCAEEDPCDPFVHGAYFEFSSRSVGECVTTDCCGDDCSGFASWTLVIDPDPCAAACDAVTGSACPVEGVVECGCLFYATETEVELEYEVTYTLLDNVGNKFEDTWTITVDTGSVVSISVPLGSGGAVTMDEPIYIYTGSCD